MSQFSEEAQLPPPDPVDLKAISKTLDALRALRSSVGDVFRGLPDGAYTDDESEMRTKRRNIKKNLTLSLNSVAEKLWKLETCVQGMGDSGNAGLFPCQTWECCQDPAIDETSLYKNMINTHRWFNRLKDYSDHMVRAFREEEFKRCEDPLLDRRRRQRVSPPRPHKAPPEELDGIIAMLRPQLKYMSIDVVRPCGRNAILKITLARTLKAIIVLHGLVIDAVMVKGYQEEFFTSADDLFSPSRYEVFRKVTDNANAAMLNYTSPDSRLLGLRSFLYWLGSYLTLFSAKCTQCNKLLMNNCPPTWRNLQGSDPYHESCRP